MLAVVVYSLERSPTSRGIRRVARISLKEESGAPGCIHSSSDTPVMLTLSYCFVSLPTDPKHPNCLRVIQIDGATAKISGTDGNPDCPADGSGKEWNLAGKIQGDNILVDFSPKGGPKDLKGVFDGTGIE